MRIKYVYPAFLFMLCILALPHGTLETTAFVCLLVYTPAALYKIWKA